MSASDSRDDSFDVETNSPFYFNTSHWHAVDGMLEGVRERAGLMLLTGPTGSGKTMIMRAISEGLEEHTPGFFQQYASLNFREFVNFLHSSLHVEDEIMDAANKAVALREFLYVQAKRNETGVIFIDEAHNLEPDVLKMLPKLARFDTLEDGRVVGLQFVLIASEDLREIIADPEYDEVREKIAIDHTLRFFTRAELKQFLKKRLAPIARMTDEPITEDGIEEMERYTGGSPRLIGMICSHAMLFAAENPGRSIDATMVREAADALMLSPVQDAFTGDKDAVSADAPFSEAELSGDTPDAPPELPTKAETIYSPYEDEDDSMSPSLQNDPTDQDDVNPAMEPAGTLDTDASADLHDEGDAPAAFDPAAFDRTLEDEAEVDDLDEFDDLDDLDDFDDMDDPDDDASKAAGKPSVKAGATSFLARLGLGKGKDKADKSPKIMGASRKKERADTPKAEKPKKKRPKTRVSGEREAQMKKAGIAAAVVAVLGVGYAAHKPVIGAVSGLLAGGSEQVAALSTPAPSLGSGNGADTMQAAASAPAGSDRPDSDTVSIDIQNEPSTGTGGWGSRVVVQIEKAAPQRDAEMAPALPPVVAGLARGALDMVDKALVAGETGAKSDKVGGILAAASDSVAGMRDRVVRDGMSGDASVDRAAALIASANLHYAERRFIAPSGRNAYDDYREALTLQPQNAEAQAGITKLREHFAQKAEGARDARQWESANSFFEIAIAISNLRAVN